jgi:hypothetical protein
MLWSSKKGSDRVLEPSEGSSELIVDHLAGLYSAAELQRCAQLDAARLEAYLQQHAPSLSRPRRPTMRVRDAGLAGDGGQNRADLGEEEQRVLVECYQHEHLGATLSRVHVVGSGVFTVHLDVPEPTCLLAGRQHTSPEQQHVPALSPVPAGGGIIQVPFRHLQVSNHGQRGSRQSDSYLPYNDP